MGSAQSLITSQNLLAAVIFVAIFIATVWRNRTNLDVTSASVPSDKTVNKKGKKKRSAGEVWNTSAAATAKENPQVVASNSLPSAQTVPGGIPESAADSSPPTVSKPVKEKKRKGKKSGARLPSGATSESSIPVAGPSRPATGSRSSPTPQPPNHPSADPLAHPPTTEPWTRVESRRKSSGQNPATSDAGVTTATSVEEDGSSSGAMEKMRDEENNHSQRTLAEKLLPKGRKTAVDDMLESPHYPELSRVIRVAPAASEKPAAGFSWKDYEDVEDIKGADADGEDDGGWGVVKSRGKAKHSQSSSAVISSSPPQSKAPETLTKRQRQHSAKRAAEKAAREDAEAARQAVLAKHKRDLERERIAEQSSHKGPGSTRRNVSGGIVNPDN